MWTGSLIPFVLLALVVVTSAVFVVLQRSVRVPAPAGRVLAPAQSGGRPRARGKARHWGKPPGRRG